MTFDYDRRIARAGELKAVHPESSALLTFYIGLANIQRDIFSALRSSGATDARALTGYFPRLIDFAANAAPKVLATFAGEHLGDSVEQTSLLISYWEGDRASSPEAQFFARTLLQPFAESLAERGVPDQATSATCPFCSAKPVVAVLRGEGDGGKRSLICSMCSTEWPYRRVVCPNCGEENKDHLPIYIAEQPGYVRVDACDTCKTYLKSVDLTKNGHAVPMVDELATVALNIWAEERGYAKLEANMLGM
jgi:FdhE protein